MPTLLSFSTLGQAHNAPRFWIEGNRLESLGFKAGVPIEVKVEPQGLSIVVSNNSARMVSARKKLGTSRAIIDVNSVNLLGHLSPFTEMKLQGTFGRLSLAPSARAFNIARSLSATGPLRVLDLFCGGGTKSDGFHGNPRFKVVAGVEIETEYANEFTLKHPDAEIILGDFRRMLPAELPDHDVLIAGIPCVEHSTQGRAKKGLGDKPELGELGDLYVHVLTLIAAKLPLAICLENVPSFGTSLAGMTMAANLERLGYSVQQYQLKPNEDWNEPTTRNRWVLIATLRPGFRLAVPGTPFSGKVGDSFDAPDFARDAYDAGRIAASIESLKKHNARHAAMGNGFAMKVLAGHERAAPTICKSYDKVNSSGFFVETAFGPRLLRKAEIERLHGQRIINPHYSTAVQMMGQGVLTRVFAEIFRQMGNFLLP